MCKIYDVTVIVFVDVRMNVVRATSVTLKKLLLTKSGAAFITSYHAKCRNETLTELLHPFKHDAKKKVSFGFSIL